MTIAEAPVTVPASSRGGLDGPAWLGRAVWVLVVAGIGLRVWQFAGFASLHNDELNLARDIADQSYAGLWRPLGRLQVAPSGFLFLERLLWSLFHTDWSLRVVPLLGAIASVLLFRVLAYRVLAGVAVLLAVAAFAAGVPFIAYGSQVKQYSTDVALSLLVLLVAESLLEPSGGRRRHAFAGLAGFLAVWFSNATVMVVVGAGAALGVLAAVGSLAERRKLLLLTLAPWAVSVLGVTAESLQAVSPETMAYMKEYWRAGFLPAGHWTLSMLLWPWRTLHGVFGYPEGLQYPFLASMYTLLAIGGAALLWSARRPIAIVLVAPVLVTFGMAAAHVYPFAGRLVLFLTPIFMLLAALAGGRVIQWMARRSRAASVLVALALLAPPTVGIVTLHPVYDSQPYRRLFAWMSGHWRRGDVLLSSFRSRPAVAWYGDAYGLTAGEEIRGGCWQDDPRGYLRDIDRARGRPRVWLLLTGAGRPEARAMVHYADAIGSRRDGVSVHGARAVTAIEAWLYDFSDTLMLAQASAEAFPLSIPPPSRITEVMVCTGARAAQATAAP